MPPLNNEILEFDPELNYSHWERKNINSYFTLEEYNALNQFNHEFKILTANIRSFFKNIDSLVSLLKTFDKLPEVIVLTETWLKEDKLALACIEGYDAFHITRQSGLSGGVSIFCSKSLKCIKVDQLSISNPTIECCTVNLKLSKNVIIIGVYRPHPDSYDNFSVVLESILADSLLQGSNVVICGDFNINMMNVGSEPCDSLLNLLNSYNFKNILKEPTRFSELSQSSLLDQYFVNFSNINSSGILMFELTDHCPIFLHVNIESLESHIPLKYNFRIHNEESLLLFIMKVSMINWDFTVDGDLDQNIKRFLDILNGIYCKTFHKKTKIFHMRGTAPWVTRDLKRKIKQKSMNFKLYKSGLISRQSAVSFRNHLTSEIRKAKSQYFVNKFDQVRNETAKTWRVINNVLNRNVKKTSIDELLENDVLINEPSQISNCLNEYFVSIGRELSENTQISGSFSDYLLCPRQNSFYLSQVDPTEVKNVIIGLKNSAHDIYTLPVYILKMVSDIISFPICNMINHSFNSGIFPEILKSSIVTPIHKSGDKKSKNNYRPISVLGTLTKIFEKCIAKRLNSYISKFQILTPCQFGFTKGKSTQNAVLSLVESIYKDLNFKRDSVSIYLDLRKAFDTVDHYILLCKLDYYGIRGVPLSLFKSYLTGRTQRVKIGTVLSRPMTIDTGVPQGSNLGPLLFLIYINDIVYASNKFRFTIFADDTVLSFSSGDRNDLNTVVNEELQNVDRWIVSNKLVLNYEKSHWMLHSTKNLHDINFNLIIGTHNLKKVMSTKYLGVILDSSLRFNLHIEELTSKISKTAGMMYRLKFYVPKSVLLKLYYSLVYPYLIYCILIWGAAADVHLNKVFVIQKRIIRYLTNSTYLSHTNGLFLELKVLKVHDIYKFLLGIYSYKMSHDQNFMYPVHQYNTRNYSDPVPLFQRLTLTQKSIYYTAPKYFSEIPLEVRRSRSISVFKRMLRDHLINLYRIEQ